MKYDFNYLIDQINEAKFIEAPFQHIYLENFFSDSHFIEVINSKEIAILPSENDEALFLELKDAGYKIIHHPGCIIDKEKYIKWHKGEKKVKHHSACEGFGIALRLYSPQTQIMKELIEFLGSSDFNNCLAEKFGNNLNDCDIDGGIQKYLDGYEISPHPDLRRKAVTYMVNINPKKESESMNHHTHYLKFKSQYRYVQAFWEENELIDRCWVPWNWCETKFIQSRNNSIVLFQPTNDTLHAVKASYNHLNTQRTQLYGNLWFKENNVEGTFDWEDFDLQLSNKKNKNIRDKIPDPVRNFLKMARSKILKTDEKAGGKSFYDFYE